MRRRAFVPARPPRVVGQGAREAGCFEARLKIESRQEFTLGP